MTYFKLKKKTNKRRNIPTKPLTNQSSTNKSLKRETKMSSKAFIKLLSKPSSPFLSLNRNLNVVSGRTRNPQITPRVSY